MFIFIEFLVLYGLRYIDLSVLYIWLYMKICPVKKSGNRATGETKNRCISSSLLGGFFDGVAHAFPFH